MIRTVTLNTGYDEIIRTSGFAFGGVGTLDERSVIPSGKGINASRVLRALGTEVTAYALVGGADLEDFATALISDGIVPRLVPVAAKTRRNLTLWPSECTVAAAHLRSEGFTLTDPGSIEQLLEMLAADLQPNDFVSLHGSMPVGIAANTWSRFGTVATSAGATLAADIYGEALLDMLANCDLLACKPNVEEARIIPEATGLSDLEAARVALHYMSARGVRLPMVTLGKEGILFAIDGVVHSINCYVSRPQLLVGAGDACMAGLASVLEKTNSSALDAVIAATAAACAHVAAVELSLFREATHLFAAQVVIR